MNRLRILCCAALFVVVIANPALAQCGGFGANPTDWEPDGQALQACFDANSYVYLDPGYPGYIVDHQVMVRSHIRLITSSGSKAKLLAHPALNRPIFHFEPDAYDYEMSELIFDGNKWQRTDFSGCDVEYKWQGSNILAKGTNFRIHHIDTVNAQCGTGLEVVGNDFAVYSVYAAYNGFSKDEANGHWADGITILRCTRGTVSGNWSHENTDVGLMVFGGSGCSVEWNDIRNYERYSFAGLSLGDRNANNDFAGGWIAHNNIESGYNMLSTGIQVGPHPEAWIMNNAGEIRYNHVSGAVVNLVVEGINDGVVMDNDLHDAQGDRHNLCPGFSANYTAAHFGIATLAPGYICKEFHSCSIGCQ